MDSVTTVPLNKLMLSDLNVRKSVDQRDVDDFAASIDARGLDHNLVVIPAERAGMYEVIAGGIRFRALLKLLAAKKIGSKELIPVNVKDRADARIISLCENIDRVAMNPAEEIEAFAAIVADHQDERDPIAFTVRRTGRSRDIVEQRLRLAKLPAPILDALRAGKIGIQSANAYGSVPDPDLQLQVFEAEERREHGERHRPREIRYALQLRTLPANSLIARYVGIEAYTAAGGIVSADLFMGSDQGEVCHDVGRLDQLARAKAEAELPALATRDGFASGLVTKGLNGNGAFPATPKGYIFAGRFIGLADIPAEQRSTAIGVYTVGDVEGAAMLKLEGWFAPIAAPARPSVADEPTATPRLAGRHQNYFPAGAGGDRAPRPGQQLHDRALELVAARIAAEHVVGDTFADNAQWPNEKHGFVPPIETAIGDDDTILVTVQIRVSRAEIEAHIHEAEEQMEANAQANDRVIDATVDPADSGGGANEEPSCTPVMEPADA